ncbi:MAG: flagellar basal body rod C-terminal domain-containing protein [Candidatus Melainabacteria bacterium]|nr:flagellar basal body rod C-terminal domain-containing protein [Candidatus Melainabacteria bacterium]
MTIPYIEGRVSADQGDGIFTAARSMAAQLAILNVHTDNIANFGVPGYQRKSPVVHPFSDYIGPDQVEPLASQTVGRLRNSGQPLDFALAKPGYFQRLNPESGQINLSRDGRFKVNPDGTLLSLDGRYQILSTAGTPLRLPYVPENLNKQVQVGNDGAITFYEPKTGNSQAVGTLSVVSPTGAVVTDVEIRQGFVEDSNVYLQEEFVGIMPVRRQFEANRQLFILQNDTLSRMIQELGRAQ